MIFNASFDHDVQHALRFLIIAGIVSMHAISIQLSERSIELQ